MILGIDEVGRGAWAGPLVVGAVSLNGALIDGLTDSKNLTKLQREKLYEALTTSPAAIGLGWVDAVELDEIGLRQSLIEATKRAVQQIQTPYHEIIIDGTVNFLETTAKASYVTTLKKADLLIPSVSAASIVAKVARDRYMSQKAGDYPEYGFERHVGYGTARHSLAIQQYGVTPLHRLSFAPLVKYQSVTADVREKNPHTISTKQIGDKGEDAAVKYLQSQGHVILYRNWKTRVCEIDIISKFNSTIYFTEVKYRQSSQYGGGLSAVTHKKLQKMKFAADYFRNVSTIAVTAYRLAVADVAGDYQLNDWIVID